MRKPRPSPTGLKAQLATLTPDRFSAFHRMLHEDITYRQMCSRATAEFGIKTSEAGLSTYYKEHGQVALMAHAGAHATVTLSRFELLISCPRPGVVSIMARELAPQTIEMDGATTADA